MADVALTVDGLRAVVPEGTPLLDAVRGLGIRLATLCQLDGVSPRGACRLCLVEVEGEARPVAACVTPAREGLKVRTRTERLLAHRRLILELLLAERSHACAVCAANRRCELQAAAAEAGVDHVRFDLFPADLPPDASHPRFTADRNRCILCGRCLRVCDEIEKARTIDFMGRGRASRVIFDLNRPWGRARSCTGCGECVRLCPTGALTDRGPAGPEGTP